MDSGAVFGRHILQLVYKLRMGEVVHLLPPQSDHTRKIEVFKTDDVVPSAKVVRELPLKIGTSVPDYTMDSAKLFASVLVVVASLFRERQSMRGSFEFVRSRLRKRGLPIHEPSESVMYVLRPKSTPTDAPLCVFS